MHHSVAIIGAGLAGLTVAYRLLQKGIDVHVYEARQRVGGRILTALLNDTLIELGAQNILDGGKAENILKLIAELQLATREGKIRSRFHYYDGETLMNTDESLRQWQQSMSQDHLKNRLHHLEQTSQNMDQVLHALFASSPELYRRFAIRLMGYEGIDAQKLSPRYIAALEGMLQSSNHLDNDDHQYIDYSIIEGGNARLVEKLKEKLGDRISLGMPLKVLTKSLAKSPGNSCITLKFEDGQVVEADRVVLAFPCSVYQDIHFMGEEALLSRLPDIQAVAYGEHAKLMVPVHIPETVEGIYANDRFGTFSMATPNIVTMYYLNRNVSFTPSTLQEVFKRDHRFLEFVYQDKSLAHLHPLYAQGEHFVSYRQPVGYNWVDDPYSQGTYSCFAAGQEDVLTATTHSHGETVKSLFSPIDDRLFFAGEHATVLMDYAGTMEAAVETGERTARMMMGASFLTK